MLAFALVFLVLAVITGVASVALEHWFAFVLGLFSWILLALGVGFAWAYFKGAER